MAIAPITALSVHSCGGAISNSAARLRGRFRQTLPQTPVGGDATADTQTPQAGLADRQQGLADEAVDDRFLKTGRQVGDLLRRQIQGLEIRPPGSGDGVAHGRLQPAEAEIQPRLRPPAATAGSGRPAGCPTRRRATDAGPPGYGKPSMLATLSNASPAASSMVPPNGRNSKGSRQWYRLLWPPLTIRPTQGNTSRPLANRQA